jgi:hypothetical protein
MVPRVENGLILNSNIIGERLSQEGTKSSESRKNAGSLYDASLVDRSVIRDVLGDGKPHQASET